MGNAPLSEKVAYAFVIILLAAVVAALILGGWGFVQLVDWITSK